MKVLFADRSGLCLFYKQLDEGTFRQLESSDASATSIVIDEDTLDDLLDGIDVEAKPRKQRRPRVH